MEWTTFSNALIIKFGKFANDFVRQLHSNAKILGTEIDSVPNG